MKGWFAYEATADPTAAVSGMKWVDMPVPACGPKQMLVKTTYAAINPIDWKMLMPVYQGMFPCTFPYVPGFDASGVVVAVGAEVTKFSLGDEICVDLGVKETCGPGHDVPAGGAFAEYFVTQEELTSKKPPSISFEHAAALPLAGMTSLQALVDQGSLQPGQKVLVLGGSSATGTYAIQLAKNCLGASETWTTASSNLTPAGSTKIDFCKALGAEVIDYKRANWWEVLAGKDFDLIYDCVGTPTDVAEASKVLKKGGIFVTIANFAAVASGDFTVKPLLVSSVAADCDKLLAWAVQGKITIPVDSVIGVEAVKDGLLKSIKMSDVSGKVVVKF